MKRKFKNINCHKGQKKKKNKNKLKMPNKKWLSKKPK